ncbi:MAG: glycosyltransferase family 4 protein [Burkholderiaceae bacterium]
MRWPVGTGIRRMADLYRASAPACHDLRELLLRTRIGSPLSPIAVSGALRRAGARRGDLFWNPGFIPPLPGAAMSVVTVHDLTHLHYYTPAHRAYYNAVFRPLYRRCDLIVCISEFTRAEFLQWSGMPEERVVVVPNAIDPAFSQASGPACLERPFVFYAGNRRGYKNVPLLLRAFIASGLAAQGVELVLTGAPDDGLRAVAEAAGIAGSLRFTGFLDDAALVAHYKAARCFAFISKYEGFGLPILEAMQCDTPLLLARASSLPEVGGDAALYVNPDDVDEVAAGLRRLCLDESARREFIDKGRRRREAYSADVSAAKLWYAIGRVAEA